MLADESDPARCVIADGSGVKFGLTIFSTDLIWSGNDDLDSQGYYDYQAHAHVSPGGADPLESQGCASAVSNPETL
jgi:hypothetical protein